MSIDVAFDFRQDTPEGLDPDAWSPTLRHCHQILWSKALPSGRIFDLSVTMPGAYLFHSSDLGAFRLSSDAVIQTFTRWERLKPITGQFPDAEHQLFMSMSYTIGGMMVFPSNPVDGQWTINQARGCIGAISDRFDLTLECIRRHYLQQDSPLAATLARYPDFFDLFGDFNGYVSFFLLDDLVAPDGTVQFFIPFDDFRAPHVPDSFESYETYRHRSIDFVQARNRRIARLGL